jgi:putative restriction endonuclease
MSYSVFLNDEAIRLAAFEWLNEQVKVHEEILPRKLLSEGFMFQDERIHLLSAQGIFKPRIMDLPLSITTSPNSPYSDKRVKEGVFEYRYRGTEIKHRDNIGLRECMRQKKPLIYFIGIDPGWYFVVYPVYIIHDDPSSLSFTVQADQQRVKEPFEMIEETDAAHWRRTYATILTEVRLHQQKFRFRVLSAYQGQCTFCKLKHRELLDAAHIIGDKEEKGEPVVPNGLSLCKIHHAAFDKNILGITPDYQIKVREDILEEVDGPMLQHGIKDLQDKKIYLPNHKLDYPDRERLEMRYSLFRKVG